jgi:hypothetical protein
VVGALREIAGDGVVLSFQHLVLVGNVQSRQYGEPLRIYSRSLGGDGAHLGVNQLGKLENVIGIRPAKMISLIENLYAHAIDAVLTQRSSKIAWFDEWLD